MRIPSTTINPAARAGWKLESCLLYDYSQSVGTCMWLVVAGAGAVARVDIDIDS